MFRYERVNSKRKFSIVAVIVFLLKKIYKRDVPLRAMFNVKTLAVLFSPYPREMKTNTTKFKSAAILTHTCFYGNCVSRSHARPNRMRRRLTAVFRLPSNLVPRVFLRTLEETKDSGKIRWRANSDWVLWKQYKRPEVIPNQTKWRRVFAES